MKKYIKKMKIGILVVLLTPFIINMGVKNKYEKAFKGMSK